MSSLLASCFLFFPLLVNPGSPFHHHHLQLRSSRMIHSHSSDSHLILPTLSNNGWTSNLQELVENNDLSSHTIQIKMGEEKKIAGIIRGLRVSPPRRLEIELKLVSRMEQWFRENGADRVRTHTWQLIKTTTH